MKLLLKCFLFFLFTLFLLSPSGAVPGGGSCGPITGKKACVVGNLTLINKSGSGGIG